MQIIIVCNNKQYLTYANYILEIIIIIHKKFNFNINGSHLGWKNDIF